jgi:hypothetical protein
MCVMYSLCVVFQRYTRDKEDFGFEVKDVAHWSFSKCCAPTKNRAHIPYWVWVMYHHSV